MSGPVLAKEDELVFYNLPASYYSMRVRIALLEKELTFTEYFMDVFKWDQMKPWYIPLHPKGHVPLLQHGEKFIPDSVKIIEYLDEKYKNMILQPDKSSDLGKNVAKFATRLDGINMNMLTFGSATYKDVTEDVHMASAVRSKCKDFPGLTVTELKRLAEAHPELRELYLAKLGVWSKFVTDLKEKTPLLKEIEHTRNVLQDVEKQLGDMKKAFPDKTSWLCGESFTVADICLAVLLLRLQYIGLSMPLFEGGKLSLLEDYFHRVKERPSVKKASDFKVPVSYLIPDFVPALVASVGVAVLAIGLGVFLVKKFK